MLKLHCCNCTFGNTVSVSTPTVSRPSRPTPPYALNPSGRQRTTRSLPQRPGSRRSRTRRRNSSLKWRPSKKYRIDTHHQSNIIQSICYRFLLPYFWNGNKHFLRASNKSASVMSNIKYCCKLYCFHTLQKVYCTFFLHLQLRPMFSHSLYL